MAGCTAASIRLPNWANGQTLRDHLCPGSFMGLLPLLHFLGQLLGDQGWKLPAPRAAFVIDDPNLHWPSYGFLKYPQLAEHASRHGYHLAFATVPLDGWRVDARAVATMREHPAALSLLIHGNDHVARELAGLEQRPPGGGGDGTGAATNRGTRACAPG